MLPCYEGWGCDLGATITGAGGSVSCPGCWVSPVPGSGPQDQLPNLASEQAAVWEWPVRGSSCF